MFCMSLKSYFVEIYTSNFEVSQLTGSLKKLVGFMIHDIKRKEEHLGDYATTAFGILFSIMLR